MGDRHLKFHELWDNLTAAAFAAGVLGAIAIMIGPITPWPLDVAVLGLALLVLAAAVLTTGLLRNRS